MPNLAMVGGVSWSRGVDDSRTIRVLLHVAIGVPLGLAVLLIAKAAAPTFAAPGAVAIATGAVLIVAAAAVGARYVGAPKLTSTVAERVTVESDAEIAGVRPLGLVLAAIVAGAVLWVAASAGLGPLLVTALLGHLVPALGVGLLRTNGRLDAEDGRLSYGDDEFPLRALSSIRSRRVGDTVFLWCTFARGSGRTPGLVVVPAWVYEDHRVEFDEGIAAADGVFGEPDRPLRLVAYGFGAGMVCLGAFSTGVLYVGGVSLLVGAFVGGSLALLGAFFVVLGRYET